MLPVGVCLVDAETSEILLANDAAACILDVAAAQDLVGRSVLQLVQRRRRREVQDYLRHVMETAPLPKFFHERLELTAGRQIDLEIAAGILNLGGRSVIQLAFRDITDQTNAEAALRASEALFRTLAETAEAAIFLFRGSHNIYVNAAACRITGFDYDDLVAVPFWQILHPDYRDLVRERGLARQHGEEVVSNYEVAILTKSGETRWLQYAGNLIDYQGQPAVLGTAIDITARKEIEQALRTYTRRLEDISRRLVQIQEIERRAVARELHDEVGQTLTALSIHLELASRAGSEEQPQRLAETQHLVEELTERVRRMSLDLRPPMLDDLGLLPTLLWYFERIEQQYRLQVAFEHHGIERRFDADIETAIFRIVQEALTNVARHAQVQVASVRLWADAVTISAQIEDKGQGFDSHLVLSHNNTNGLRGMQERARLLAGKLVIEAQPGSGACLTALLPLPGVRQPEHGGSLV